MKTDCIYTELIGKYKVNLSCLEPLKYTPNDETVYIEEFRILQETLERKYLLDEVIELINNAISHKLIQLREEIDECEEDIIKE